MSTPSLSAIQPSIPSNSVFELSYSIFAEQLNQQSLSVSQYLQLHMPAKPSSEVDAWLSDKAITIDGKQADADTILAPDQQLNISLGGHFEQRVNTQWQLIWQNTEIMALYKPAPLAVSRTTRNLYDTLIGLVRRQTPFLKAQLLHRLDIETSGLILLAKDQASDVKWKKNLNQLIEKKIYHAIVKGVPSWQEYQCENQLAERTDSEIRCKMYVVDESLPIDLYTKPKQCKSLFKCLKSQGEYSLIECRIYTGRKHQIRAQLAGLGLPIVGDKIYSNDGEFFLKRLQLEQGLTDSDYHVLGAKNHLLKAVALELRFPDQQTTTNISCPGFCQDLSQEIYPNMNN